MIDATRTILEGKDGMGENTGLKGEGAWGGYHLPPHGEKMEI
jgi:hypothetical protein